MATSSNWRRFSWLLVANLVAFYINSITAAQIGDGSISLYTGKAIDLDDDRGSCEVNGLEYPSETSIPRDHPCHYCICYQSQIACYWKQCSAPPPHCTIMQFDNVCNPSLYVCDILEEAKEEPVFGRRIKRRKRKRRLPRALPDKSGGVIPIREDLKTQFDDAWEKYSTEIRSRSKRAILSDPQSRNLLRGDTSCTILGVLYNLGDVIGVSSDVCMECRCAAGRMFCSPRCCFNPYPLNPSHTQMSVFVLSEPPPSSPHPLHYVRNQYEDNHIR